MKRPSKRKTISDLSGLLFQLVTGGCDARDCVNCSERVERVASFFGLKVDL